MGVFDDLKVLPMLSLSLSFCIHHVMFCPRDYTVQLHKDASVSVEIPIVDIRRSYDPIIPVMECRRHGNFIKKMAQGFCKLWVQYIGISDMIVCNY